MKAVLSTLISLVAVAAFANPPAAAPKETKTTTTETATTPDGAKHEMKHEKTTKVDCKDAKNKDKAECKAAH